MDESQGDIQLARLIFNGAIPTIIRLSPIDTLASAGETVPLMVYTL
jgi:hypothetical protein